MAKSTKQVNLVNIPQATKQSIQSTIKTGNSLGMKASKAKAPTLKAPSAMRKGGRTK